MLDSNEKVLILGASGLVGRYLYDYLIKKKIDATGTYNKNKKNDNLIHFDITRDDISSILSKETKYAIICSAIAKIDECISGNEISYNTNVTNTKRIISSLLEKKVTPIFISGAVVFDGKGDENEEDKKNPVNEYGRQKLEIEDFLTSQTKDCIIIRPGKIFGINKNEGIFSEFLGKYKSGKEIMCARDEMLSLTYAADFSRGIFELMNHDSRGVFHINNPEYKSRLEFAEDFFDHFNLKGANIKSCSLDDINLLEKRGKNIYLDSSKFIRETGFKFTRLEYCFNLMDINNI